MRFLIAGAGAIGAYIGARMARAELDVTLFARGPHLRAMQEHGVRVESIEGDFEARPKVSGNLDEIGPVDVVLLTVKAHSLPQLAPQLWPVLAGDTPVVTMQNGVPWWYFQGCGGQHEGTRLERVDPCGWFPRPSTPPRGWLAGGFRDRNFKAWSDPGTTKATEFRSVNRTGRDQNAAAGLRKRLIGAGLRCLITTRIRHDIWVKILGNVAFNPISAPTGATLIQMLRDPEVSALVRNVMQAKKREWKWWPPDWAWSCRSLSNSGSLAPKRLANIRPRCCRTLRRDAPWNLNRS